MEGVTQNIRNWGEEYIPHLFRYTQLVMAVNPDKVLYGTCGTPAKYFVSWHEDDKEWLNNWMQKMLPRWSNQGAGSCTGVAAAPGAAVGSDS